MFPEFSLLSETQNVFQSLGGSCFVTHRRNQDNSVNVLPGTRQFPKTRSEDRQWNFFDIMNRPHQGEVMEKEREITQISLTET